METIKLTKNVITLMPSDKDRIYHELEGVYGNYYFQASTDNSHKKGYVSDGINNGSVYKLTVWIGGNPVGRDSVKGKGIHVSEDYVAGFWNKWEKRPATKHKKIIDELVKKLEVIANKKA